MKFLTIISPENLVKFLTFDLGFVNSLTSFFQNHLKRMYFSSIKNIHSSIKNIHSSKKSKIFLFFHCQAKPLLYLYTMKQRQKAKN